MFCLIRIMPRMRCIRWFGKVQCDFVFHLDALLSRRPRLELVVVDGSALALDHRVGAGSLAIDVRRFVGRVGRSQLAGRVPRAQLVFLAGACARQLRQLHAAALGAARRLAASRSKVVAPPAAKGDDNGSKDGKTTYCTVNITPLGLWVSSRLQVMTLRWTSAADHMTIGAQFHIVSSA